MVDRGGVEPTQPKPQIYSLLPSPMGCLSVAPRASCCAACQSRVLIQADSPSRAALAAASNSRFSSDETRMRMSSVLRM